jgi:hypothetical protein
MKPTEHKAEVLAGVAMQEITPEYPISMGGYGQRAGQLSEGVHDDLYVKALFFQNGDTKVLILTADLISIPDAIYKRVLDGLTRSGVIGESELCLSASHTHSGPDVEESIIIASPIKEYLDDLVEKMIRVGIDAARSPVPVNIKVAVGKADFLANRRTSGDNPPTDSRVLALEVCDPITGKPLAVLFSAGCHAVCLGYENLQISADYPGFAQRYIEKELGVEAALFINMTEGNIIPSTRPQNDSLDPRGYKGGTFGDAEKIGSELAREVVHILGKTAPLPDPVLFVRKKIVQVEPAHNDLGMLAAWKILLAERKIILQYLPDFKEASPFNLKPVYTLWRDASAVVIERDMSEAEMRTLMSAVARFLIMAMKLGNPAFRKPYQLTVQVIGINDLHILSLPGEVLVEVGKDWQARQTPNESKAFIFGLSNGFAGYLPHPDNFKEAGAEYKYETIMNALEPEATLIALKTACDMFQEGERHE